MKILFILIMIIAFSGIKGDNRCRGALLQIFLSNIGEIKSDGQNSNSVLTSNVHSHFQMLNWHQTKNCYILAKQIADREKEIDKKNEVVYDPAQRSTFYDKLDKYMVSVNRYRESVLYKHMMIEFCGLSEEFKIYPTEGIQREILFIDKGVFIKDLPESEEKYTMMVNEGYYIPKVWPFQNSKTFESVTIKSIYSGEETVKEIYKTSGINCTAVRDLKTEETSYGAEKMNWIAFGSTDPTSDYDFSIDIEIPDFNYANDQEPHKDPNYNEVTANLITRQLAVIDSVATLWKKSTSKISKAFTYIDKSKNEEERAKDVREVEEVADSNGYPLITTPYLKLWNHDEDKTKADDVSKINYYKFQAAIEFSVCDASSLLLLDAVNSGDLLKDLFSNKEDEEHYVNLQNTLFNCKIFAITDVPTKERFNIYYKIMANKIFNMHDLTKGDTADFNPTTMRKNFLILNDDQKKDQNFQRKIVQNKNEIYQNCFTKTDPISDTVRGEDKWLYFGVLSGCRVWANEASITYGSLQMNLDEKTQVLTYRAVAESVLENLSLLIVHVFEIYVHANGDITDTNVSDKIKYLSRTYHAIKQFDYFHKLEGKTFKYPDIELEMGKRNVIQYKAFKRLIELLDEEIKDNKSTPGFNKKIIFNELLKCYYLERTGENISETCNKVQIAKKMAIVKLRTIKLISEVAKKINQANKNENIKITKIEDIITDQSNSDDALNISQEEDGYTNILPQEKERLITYLKDLIIIFNNLRDIITKNTKAYYTIEGGITNFGEQMDLTGDSHLAKAKTFRNNLI